ncbi:hypothetical protein D3C76_1386430 [compost metagenome]
MHQTVVGGDIRLALGGIDDQGLYLIAAAAQFGSGWEARAAQTSHAKLMDALDQRLATLRAIIAPAVAIDPAVFTVCFNSDA